MTQYFDPTDGLIHLVASLRGPVRRAAAEMALDTGATYTVLSRRLLREVGVDLGRPIRRLELAMGAGLVPVEMFRIDELSALGHSRASFRVVAYDLPADLELDGLLGLDFLARRRLTLDFRRGSLELF